MNVTFKTQSELESFLNDAPSDARIVAGEYQANYAYGWNHNRYMGGASNVPTFKVAEILCDLAKQNVAPIVVTSKYGVIELIIKQEKVPNPPLDSPAEITKVLSTLPVDSIIMVEYEGRPKYKQTYRKANAMIEKWVGTHLDSADSIRFVGETFDVNKAKKIWVIYNPDQHNPPRPEYVAHASAFRSGQLKKYKLSNMNPCRVVESATGTTIATFAQQSAAEEFVKEMNK